MKKSMNLKKIVTAALLIALGVIIPQAFHFIAMENAGKIFLPMYLPVILSGMLLGPWYGMAVGLITPVLSFLVTGGTMPAVPFLYFMIIELMAYAFFSGILIKLSYNSIFSKGKLRLIRKFNVIITLLISFVVCELLNAGVMLAAGHIFGLTAPFLKGPVIASTFLMGIPGMICQLVLLPIIMYALKKGGFTFAGTTKSN